MPTLVPPLYHMCCALLILCRIQCFVLCAFNLWRLQDYLNLLKFRMKADFVTLDYSQLLDGT